MNFPKGTTIMPKNNYVVFYFIFIICATQPSVSYSFEFYDKYFNKDKYCVNNATSLLVSSAIQLQERTNEITSKMSSSSDLKTISDITHQLVTPQKIYNDKLLSIDTTNCPEKFDYNFTIMKKLSGELVKVLENGSNLYRQLSLKELSHDHFLKEIASGREEKNQIKRELNQAASECDKVWMSYQK